METLQEYSQLARQAFSWTYFDPEKQGKRTIEEGEAELNGDLENMPESERERYTTNYKKLFSSWLHAHCNCASSAITGGSGFNVRRAEKANNREHAHLEEFRNWREKALKAIAKKVEDEKSKEQKDDEALAGWKRQVDRLFDGWMVDRFKSRLETVARTGNVELVKSVLFYLSEMQEKTGKTVATKRHSLWSLAELAEKHRASIESVSEKESEESDIHGVRVVRNHIADRIQLFFDGKPKPEMIAELKHAAFKWSPSNGCWQRQLTNNAIYAAERLLKK